MRIPQCLLVLLHLFVISFTMAQDKSAYQLYDANGKRVKFKKVSRAMDKADLIFFGETHNDPISHWLEREITAELIATKGDKLVVGAEMFETHQQEELNNYLSGKTDRKTFEKETELWSNYKTDYHPVVELCKSAEVPVIATNIPRKFARLVSREGPEALNALSSEEKSLLAPLPLNIDYSLPSYVRMKEMLSGHGGSMKPENFIAAQASKDATMAHNILKNWEPGKVFYHLNGSYHSDDREGIVWHLLQQNPNLEILTLSVVIQDNPDPLEEENKGKGDFIIAVPATMTKTY